jgi:hypothetical protein
MSAALLRGCSLACSALMSIAAASAQPSSGEQSAPQPSGATSPVVTDPAAAGTPAEQPAPPIPPPGPVQPAGSDRGASTSIVTADATPDSGSAAARAEYEARRGALRAFIEAALTIPDSPAAFALGVASTPVARPGTIREASAAVGALVGPGGELVPGVSAEVAPVRLASRPRTVDEWSETSVPLRVLDSIRISVASAEDPAAAAEPEAAALAAVGFRVGYHANDYRWNEALRTAVRKTLVECGPRGGHVPPGPGDDIRSFSSLNVSCDPAAVDAALLKLYDDSQNEGWRLEVAATAVVAAATVLPGAASDWRSSRAWVSFEYAFRRYAFGGAVDGSVRDQAPPDSDDKVGDVRLGGFMEIRNDDVQWNVAAGYVASNLASDAVDSERLLQVGTSLALELNAWMATNLGLQALCGFQDGSECDVVVVTSLAVAGLEDPFGWGSGPSSGD